MNITHIIRKLLQNSPHPPIVVATPSRDQKVRVAGHVYSHINQSVHFLQS